MILHVGTAPQTERKLLVSSVLLSHVSLVFAAMFDGRFAEGQNLSLTSPPVVSLPDDEADAMATVCKIIHARIEDFTVNTTPTTLSSIALVAHKYDCTVAIRAWSIIWVADVLTRPSAEDFEKMVTITYLLDMPSEFRSATQSLIRDRSDLLSITAMSNGLSLLPLEFLERVVKTQYDAQRRALASVDKMFASRSCEICKMSVFSFCKDLQRIGFWLFNKSSISELKTGVESMSSVAKGCGNVYCDFCFSSIGPGSILPGVMLVFNGVQGFCLDCVKKTYLGIDSPECRIDCDGELNP